LCKRSSGIVLISFFTATVLAKGESGTIGFTKPPKKAALKTKLLFSLFLSPVLPNLPYLKETLLDQIMELSVSA
jgi:hypothetical protein